MIHEKSLNFTHVLIECLKWVLIRVIYACTPLILVHVNLRAHKKKQLSIHKHKKEVFYYIIHCLLNILSVNTLKLTRTDTPSICSIRQSSLFLAYLKCLYVNVNMLTIPRTSSDVFRKLFS